MEKSQLNKDDIDLLVPHGVGTMASDAYEAKAIRNIFGKNCQKPLITALKPYMGHNLGSCTLLETAILLMAMENDYIPATLNTQETDSKLGLSLVTQPQKTKINKSMKTVCGFAGYNAAAIFSKI